MSEQTNTKPSLLVDKEPGERYKVREGGEKVSLSSNDMLDGEVVKKELTVGDQRIEIEGLTFRGWPNKRFNEDACTVTTDGKNLQVFVVDGGTQIEPASSLGGITGGKYIADKVIEFSQNLDPSRSADENLRELNSRIGEDVHDKHPEIKFTESSRNVPYGSIAAVKIDAVQDNIEVANAGDAFVLAVKRDGEPMLLTKDDVYEEDLQTLHVAREVARQHGVTVRYAMEHRHSDPRFNAILKEMQETVRLGNIGRIRRITGQPNFDVTSHSSVRSSEVKKLFIFSDGAVPIDIDIHMEEGQKRFISLINDKGLEGLYKEIERLVREDPDFERRPRFRDVDDGIILQIELKEA